MMDDADFKRGDEMLKDWSDQWIELNQAWGYPRQTVEHSVAYGSHSTAPGRLTRPEQDAVELARPKSTDARVRAMPDAMQIVVIMRYLERMSWSEIARELDMRRDLVRERGYLAALIVARMWRDMAA